MRYHVFWQWPTLFLLQGGERFEVLDVVNVFAFWATYYECRVALSYVPLDARLVVPMEHNRIRRDQALKRVNRLEVWLLCDFFVYDVIS